MNDHEARIARLENAHRRSLSEMEALRLLLERNNTSLAEFIELAKAFKFGIKLLGLAERLAVFITKMILAFSSIWGVWKFFIKEAIEQMAKGH